MNVLAIGAHPDDIEFGCGGTLIKHKDEGHKVIYVCMTCLLYTSDAADE